RRRKGRPREVCRRAGPTEIRSRCGSRGGSTSELEDALVGAAGGEYQQLELDHDDALGAIELGVNMLVDALRGRIAEVERSNRELDQRVAQRTEELQRQLDELARKNALIERQREAIQALSMPILQLWDEVIAMPLIGVIDTQRSAEIMATLLDAIRRGGARFAILDITGVELIDTRTAAYLLQVIRAAELLGSTCILTGVQPVVAQSLVALGVNLDELLIRRDLQAALRTCLATMRRGGKTR
ncbi:MAG: STAS domain-containing protein, partial [Myxococcales bacterium]|nr:STAS domain-containing protein [Myxococcales bacterium]